MTPVFKEYIKFLKDNKIDVEKYELREGYYWIDNMIIKCFDTNGNIQKILRLKIDDDLNIFVKTVYKNKTFIIEHWNDTILRYYDNLINIEKNAIDLITSHLFKCESIPLILSSSGKDSMVVSYLVKQIDDTIKTIFSNTSLDVADTYKFIKSQQNIKIINPDEGFYSYIQRVGFIPNRMNRSCCTIFKEGAMINKLNNNDKYLFFMGMRSQESNTRSNYIEIWKNEKWGKREWLAVLPIVKWTELDIWLYTLMKNILINPKYKKGYSRVGCGIACPFYTKSTWVLDRYWYYSQFKRWHDILDNDFINNNKEIIMNCTQKEYHTCWNGSKIRDEPTNEIILEFAKRNNLDIDIAKKYFNHTCKECSKKIRSKEEIGINFKYFGRNITRFLCKKHIIKYLNIDKIKYNNIINGFKSQGCDLV